MHGGFPRRIKGLGTVTDPEPRLPEMHLETLRALYLLLDDRVGDVRTGCGGSNRLDETALLVWKLLGTGSTRTARPGISRRSRPTRRWAVAAMGTRTAPPGGHRLPARRCAVVRGMVPLSRFIARATGSPFSHTGVVAIEDGSPVVYDCSSAGVQRQPFEVWMLDSLGAPGVKRLKPEHRERIAGVIDYCRAAFERQVPFDNGFRMEDDSLYCLELTEKAFRSQGLALSEPVRMATGSTWRAFL